VTGASAPVLLAIDIGNTNVTLGTFVYGDREPVLGEHWRLATHRGQTSDEVGVVLRALFDQAAIDTRRVTDVIVSSVVPPLLPIWERVSTKLFDREPLVVGPGIRTGVPVRTENPHEVGADRIVNSVADARRLPPPSIPGFCARAPKNRAFRGERGRACLPAGSRPRASPAGPSAPSTRRARRRPPGRG
jgi:hypothetical protein